MSGFYDRHNYKLSSIILIDKKSFPDEVTFLNGRKGGDTCRDSDGDNGPEHQRNCYEEQKACQFVGQGVRKT